MMGKGKKMVDTVIICDGITNAHINPAAQFISEKASIGRQEIDRLMGSGREFGNGPLPSFLRAAIHARKEDVGVGVIILQSAPRDCVDEKNTTLQATEASDFPQPLEDIVSIARVIKTDADIIPWPQIWDAVNFLTGFRLEPGGIIDNKIRFLVMGSSTEGRPLAVAAHLINAARCKQVAVAAPLIGSSAREVHFAALRHMYTHHGVRVILDLEETFAYAGLDQDTAKQFGVHPCIIEPAETRNSLGDERQRIVELLCMHWTRCLLKPLAGGFSGSYLYVAEGWKHGAQTEPMVLKIDNFQQMRREIDGYNEVKDLLGKHIPNFGYPVSAGNEIGVGMELATMDGKPETLQDSFELADIESAFSLFKNRFERALKLISERLYRNTSRREWVIPYYQMDLYSNRQLRYLKLNAGIIASYLDEMQEIPIQVDVENLPRMLEMIASNDDGIESETCVVHGDLNYQNIICDHSDNVWFIDWTHCGRYPLELDFAKLENDVKFVMSKEFEADDLPRLKKFEEYLLANRMPADEKALPDYLRFVKWDLRYRKILSAVRIIRQQAFLLKQDEEWLVYRIALLRYALHTLSFDKRRDKGECEVQQLVHALLSSERLMTDLVMDDFHLKIRGARPSEYPPRQRISIDSALWRFECPEYSPPYYVSPVVIENDPAKTPNGWADPEDVTHIHLPDENRTDDAGRPLNPRGRTGIAGRGLLGRWGANPAVTAIITRTSPTIGLVELLLGKQKDIDFLLLPKGFVLREQKTEDAVREVIEREFGWRPGNREGEILGQGFCYDDRQTDHAWVDMTTFLFDYSYAEAPVAFNSQRDFEEVAWWPLNRNLLNELHPTQVHFVTETAERYENEGPKSIGKPISVLSENGSDQ